MAGTGTTGSRTVLSEVMEVSGAPGSSHSSYIAHHIERYGRTAGAQGPEQRQAYYALRILEELRDRDVAGRDALARRLEADEQFPIGAEGGQADWEAAWADIVYLRSNGFAVNDGGL